MSAIKYHEELNFSNICDASGAVVVDGDHFLIGNDEDNILRLYDFNRGGKPTSLVDINDYFKNNPEEDEVDIEAAAIVDDITYWITSHGRNKKGDPKPERHNFFATKIDASQASVSVSQVGHSYTNLIKAIIETESLNQYQLDKAEKLPPKAKGGLNIEGLCSTPNGELWIGFRNPIRDQKALLLPLKNPRELVEDPKVSPNLGAPVDLDLGRLGIRSIEYWEKQEIYLIAAGAYDGSAEFGFYEWSGHSEESPHKIELIDFPVNFNPEAIVIHQSLEDRFQVLSDDGSIKRADGKKCKKSSNRFFRGAWVIFQN